MICKSKIISIKLPFSYFCPEVIFACTHYFKFKQRKDGNLYLCISLIFSSVISSSKLFTAFPFSENIFIYSIFSNIYSTSPIYFPSQNHILTLSWSPAQLQTSAYSFPPFPSLLPIILPSIPKSPFKPFFTLPNSNS